jgi:Mrp family chromosome partitioning ATPase
MLQRNFLRKDARPLRTPTFDPPSDSFAETVRVFRRHGRGLAAWIAFCLALTFCYTITTPPEYSATAQLILDSSRLAKGIESGPNGPTGGIDASQLESLVHVTHSTQVLRFVFQELNLRNDPEFGKKPSGDVTPLAEKNSELAAFANFSSRVTARKLGQSQVVEISFRSSSAARAARVANAIALSYMRYQIEFRILEMARSDWLQSRMDDLRLQERAVTQSIRDGVMPKMALTASPAQLISEAEEPLHKTSPQTSLLLASALTFALLTGLGFVSIKNGLDHTIRSRRHILEGANLEYLGTIPHEQRITFMSLGGLANFLRLNPAAGFSRNIDSLVSTLLSEGAVTKSPRVIGVVSPSRKTGASTIAVALALRTAARGRKTALADLAPRDRELWTGRHLQFIDIAAMRATTEHDNGKHVEIEVAKQVSAYDHVVIDLPALDGSSEALANAHLLDGIIIVVEYGKTTPAQLCNLSHALYLTDTPIFGVVINKAPEPR